MLGAILALITLFAQRPAAPNSGNGVTLPHQRVSINISYAPVGEAVRQAFEKLHLKLTITNRAHAVADSIRVSVGMNDVPLDVIIHRILVPYLYLAPSLIVRKEGDVYVLDLPTVSLRAANEQPGMALHEIFDQVGCDYCIDLEAFGPHGVTLAIDNQPLDVAVKQIARASKPMAPMAVDFVDGCFVIRSTSGAREIATDSSPKVMARFLAHDRREVIAALLDCFRQNYIISGNAAGIVTIDNGMMKAADLLRKALAGGSEQYTYANMDNVYMFFPDSALGEALRR